MSAIPASRPISASRRKARTQARARTNVWGSILGGAALFAVVAVATFLASSMAGQVMVEKARREGISAQRRASDARRAEAALRSRISELTGFTAMENWALSHGYIAPDRPNPTSQEVTRVAQR